MKKAPLPESPLDMSSNHDSLPIALAITGASGAPYWRRLIGVLLRADREIHLCCSSHADEVCRFELGMPFEEALESVLASSQGRGRLRRFKKGDFLAPMASGSARYSGMAIVPCSLGTLGRIANGTSEDLITRAADVMLKERRKLVLVWRETPLSLVHLENMTALTRAGAIMMPANPGFYQNPKTIDDLVDFVVQRICDQLGVEVDIIQRWGSEEGGENSRGRREITDQDGIV